MSPFSNIEFLKRFVTLLSNFIAAPDFSPAGKLYITAVCSLGTDASPNDLAPDEFGCAETVDSIYYKAFGMYIAGTISLSTSRIYMRLRSDITHWKEVHDPQKGDIVISPTGYGNGKLSSGHVGIVGDGKIMNNNSSTGFFDEHYTLETWKVRYVDVGGFPMKYFRRI